MSLVQFPGRQCRALIIFSALLFIFVCPLSARGELKVGFIGGFSGPGQVFGEAARNGFEFARQELGSNGLSVLYEDDQFDPKKTISAFNKLVQQDKVDAVLVLGSSPATAVAPLAERQGVPLIAWASARHIAAGRKWVIRSWASGEDEGSALASKAVEMNISRLATVVYADQYANSVRQGLESAFKSSIISLGEVSPAEQDFSGLILRAKRGKAEGVFVCLGAGQVARFAKQARQLQLGVPILGCETFNSASEIELSEGALNGAWYATVSVSNQFHEKFITRFSADTSIGGSAVHYELYRLLLEIAPSAPSRERLLSYLLSVRERDSVFGRLSIARDGSDQWFRLPISTRQVIK
jgi:branched-chain amino acid transport system substrate-binding protein